jgi:hypothetical protein
LILHHDSAPAHKVFSVQQFLAQKSITQTEHPPSSPDLVPNDFWPFPKIRSALRDKDFKILKTSKESDDGTEICLTTGVLKLFPTVAASLG